RAVLSAGQVLELRVADTSAGQLRYRVRGEQPQPALLRLLGALIAQEVERSKAPAKASEAAAAAFIADVLERRVTDRENVVARGARHLSRARREHVRLPHRGGPQPPGRRPGGPPPRRRRSLPRRQRGGGPSGA